MSLWNLKGFLGEEIPTYENFVLEEEASSPDLRFILDGISSIPLYERLGVEKELLCEEEIKSMHSQAMRYVVHNEHQSENEKNHIPGEKSTLCDEEFKKLETEYTDDKENVETFLKYFYNTTESDTLIATIIENFRNEDNPLNSDEEHFSEDGTTGEPSKDFLEFFHKIKVGIYDKFVIHGTNALQNSCSDISSDEEDKIVDNKAKELTRKLQFTRSTNTRSLDHIINADKPDIFKNITESTSGKPALKMKTIFQSESEEESNNPQRIEMFKDDETSKGSVHINRKKVKNSHRNTRPKLDAEECNINNKTPNENKIDELKKPIKGESTLTHGPTESSKYQMKGSTETTSILPSVSKHPNVVNKTKKSSKNKNSSDSSDEDWQHLAEKNLYLRSKRLEQKVPKKK